MNKQCEYHVDGERMILEEHGRKVRSSPDTVYIFFKVHHKQKEIFSIDLKSCGLEFIKPNSKYKFSLQVRASDDLEYLRPVHKYIEGAGRSADFKYIDLGSLTTVTSKPTTFGDFELDKDFTAIATYFDSVFNKVLPLPPAVLIYGLSGSGKTTFAHAYKDYAIEKFGAMDMIEVYPPDTIASHWFWKEGLTNDNGATVNEVQTTPLADALLEDTDVPLFICFDEINRSAEEQLVRPLMPLLASRRIEIGGETGEVRRPFVAYSTANIGYGFSGVTRLGTAFLKRNMLFKKSPQTKREVMNIIAMKTQFNLGSRINKASGEIYEKCLQHSIDSGVAEVGVRNILIALNGVEAGMSWVDSFKNSLAHVDDSGSGNSRYMTAITTTINSNKV